MFEIILKNRVRLIGVVIVVVGLLVFQRVSKNQPLPTTYSLTTGPVQHVITASGNVSAAGQLDVYTSIKGVITELYVQNGQTVDVGTPLFSVTSTATEQEKAAAKAAYLASIDEYNIAEQNKILYQAQLEQAREAVLGKADGLNDYINLTEGQDDTERDVAYSQDWSTRKLFENAEKKFTDATQTLAAKSQNITAKKSAYEATKDQIITSAVPGTVANINPKIGDEVAIPSSANPAAEPVLSLSNFDTYTIEVNVSENDIFLVTLGQQAVITIESFPDREFTGYVSKVDTIGTVNNGLVTYTITVDLNESDIRMRAGMTSEVDIIADQRENALLIPNGALSQNDHGKIVYIQNGQTFIEQAVETGIKGDTHTEVLDGLSGNEILLDPATITNQQQP